MKRSAIIKITLCLLTLMATARLTEAQTAPSPRSVVASATEASGSAGPNSEGGIVWLKQILLELKTLRLEVLQQRLEHQEMKVALLERELQQTQLEQQRLGTFENSLYLEIAEVDKDLAQSTSNDERAELENTKAELTGDRMNRLRGRRQVSGQRESELTERLKRERLQLQELLKKAEKLRAGS
jgi:hypothetical protein